MSAMVRFGPKVAILRAGRWVSADLAFEGQLNRYTKDWFQSGAAPSKTSNPELAVAKEVARQFGGRVAGHVKPKGKASERYFFSQRQLGFDFSD